MPLALSASADLEPQGSPGKDAKIDSVKVDAGGSLVSSSRQDITVSPVKLGGGLLEKQGEHNVTVPGGGSCRNWVTFETGPRLSTTQWDAGSSAFYVTTYTVIGQKVASAFTLYLSC